MKKKNVYIPRSANRHGEGLLSRAQTQCIAAADELHYRHKQLSCYTTDDCCAFWCALKRRSRRLGVSTNPKAAAWLLLYYLWPLKAHAVVLAKNTLQTIAPIFSRTNLQPHQSSATPTKLSFFASRVMALWIISYCQQNIRVTRF